MEGSQIEEQFENRLDNVLAAGIILGLITRGLEVTHENPKFEKFLRLVELQELKDLLLQFATIDVCELLDASIMGIKPFENILPANVLRYPDQLWEESMIDDSSGVVNLDCVCEIATFNKRVWLKWTIPSSTYIEKCMSPEKLIYTAMVVVEELLHLGQIQDLNTVRLITMESDIGIYNKKALSAEDIKNMNTIRESDVTAVMAKWLGNYQHLQWFTDRSQSSKNDIHHPLTLSEVIVLAMDIAAKYGYPEEFLESIVYEIELQHSSISQFLKGLDEDPKLLAWRKKYEI